MSPSAVRDFLTALPWPNYIEPELNELEVILSQARQQIRTQRAVIRAREQAAQIEQRRLLAEHRPREELTRAQIFPPGTRFE